MSKDIKYSKLLKETFSSLNPVHWGKVGWNWLVGEVDPINRSKYENNINFKISLWVLQPTLKINDNRTEKDLKIICHALEFPFHNKKEKLLDGLRSYIFNNSHIVFNKIKKDYLDKLNEDQLNDFWNIYCLNTVKDREIASDGEIHKSNLDRGHIYAHLEVSYHNKVTRADNFEKDFYSGRLEFEKIYQNFLVLYSGLLSSDNISKEIDNLTKNIFADTDNIYKFNVDKNYNLDKSGLGGPYHRLHDESHTLHEMAKKVKDAVPDDSNITEIIAFINEFAKDVQTTMGIPVVSIKKETFDNMHSFLKPLGVNKNDLYDFLTYNLQEVLNVCFIITYYLFPSTRKNKEKLGNVYGLLTVTGAFGNPLALVVLALTLITSVIKNDFKNEKDRKELLKGAAKSAGLSLLIKFALGFFDIDSIGKLIGFFLGIAVVVILYKKGIKKVEINKFKKEFEKEIERLSKKSKFILEQTKLLEMKKI